MQRTHDETEHDSRPPALGRILVVDDESVTRRISASVLSDAGFEVSVARDGPSALDAIHAFAPDVVLLDLVMPGMDGFEVCARARAMPQGDAISILVMTGLDDVASIERAYAVGATDFVAKPVSPTLLAHRVRYLHRSARYLNQLRQSESRLRASRRRVERLAYYDMLTGLPNRTFLTGHLKRALDGARRDDRSVGLCCLDLDMFKRINDTLGHGAGDELLTMVADRLRRVVRGQDCVARTGHHREGGRGDDNAIVRLGGDEFVILLSDLRRPADAGLVANRILRALTSPFTVQRRQVFVGASIGIATFPADGEDAETLLKHADAAMYHAKESGRSRAAFYTSAMSALSRARLELETHLRQAITDDALEVHYQPKVNIRTNRMTGVEALLRWDHPERGRVSPAEFIPVAEDSGLIVPLGEWVLRQSCAQLAAWSRDGLSGIGMAVNVAARQFTDEGFVAAVRDTITSTGIEPAQLELEITEGTLMSDIDGALEVLQSLHALGVRVAIDDFGTGYSSLAYLSRFPIDTLKIDRSFVGSLEEQPRNASITEAIIAMATSLHMAVVAEGVETEAQLRFLRRRVCETVQGFYFSRPLPPTELLAWATERVDEPAA
ncbi:MAG: EAL domain-containing protein [Polyangiaceae bacterium]